MKCAYCNKEKDFYDTDENGSELCYECYEREVEFLCPICQELSHPQYVDFNFITLEDGLYYGKVEWSMGGIIREQLTKVIDGDFEDFVNGICSECSKKYKGEIK